MAADSGFTRSEAARLLGCSRRELHLLHRFGPLKHVARDAKSLDAATIERAREALKAMRAARRVAQ